MLLIYTNLITPRLQYITDFIGTQLFDAPLLLTTNAAAFASSTAPKLNYSNQELTETEFYLQPANTILFSSSIEPIAIDCFEVNFHKAFFQTNGDMVFDIFAASFYLISRYEEYLPHQKDMYGRYAHTNSLAYKENFLHQPLVNIWLEEFKKALQQKFPQLLFRRRSFKFRATYDIDIAYSYKHKGWWRNMGGWAKSVLKRQWHLAQERIDVLKNKKRDPFDAYEWLDALHLYCKVKPVYFFLVAQEQAGYDRNIPTSSKPFKQLVEYYAAVYKVGLHPSWRSSTHSNNKILKEEKEWMEAVTDTTIEHSRNHYIKFSLPEGYRRLIECGLLKDYSMGYGTTNGFRASVAASFYWFDVEKNETTPLQLYPFCFMDANAFYEQKLSAMQAYEELRRYYTSIKKVNGLMITIWHNTFLGTDINFKGWREVYELFMKEDVYWDAYM